MRRHCCDVVWHWCIAVKARGSFADELLSFKYRDSKTVIFPLCTCLQL